jgi:hypothetical protein
LLQFARRTYQGFHVIEVAFERAASGSGQAVLRLGLPSLEKLGAGDVFGLLMRVDAQIAVCRFHQLFKSLKLKDSLTASALTMPRRIRSCIKRSSCGVTLSAAARVERMVSATAFATVLPPLPLTRDPRCSSRSFVCSLYAAPRFV